MVKLEPPVNPNYAATVVRVKTLVPLGNADRLQGIPMFGLQAIVDLNTKVGDIGILFPSEVQLSPEFVCENNLYRHAMKEFADGSVVQMNRDPDKAGYLEDNRRVRAIKLRGNRSDALFLPLSSLSYLGELDLKEGDVFDRIGDREICHKYVVPTRSGGRMAAPKALSSRVDAKLFPEHFDTPQFLRVQEALRPPGEVVVTQKLHGTSFRAGNVPVRRTLSWLERLAKKLGVKVQDTEYAMVYGSHHVVKDASNPAQQHFYGTDLWTVEGRKLDGLIPENHIVYGELIGWVDGQTAIQKNYSYDVPPGGRELYVYRVAVVNGQGVVTDLSWDAVVEFCRSVGLKHVPELWRGPLREFDYTQYMDISYSEYPTAVPLCKESPCDEGVCVRFEGMSPTITKVKSPSFLAHETKILDAGVADIESTETTDESEALAA